MIAFNAIKYKLIQALLMQNRCHCGLKFHFGQFDLSEICTEVSFTYIEVKFYPKVGSKTGRSSLRVSFKRAHK